MHAIDNGSMNNITEKRHAKISNSSIWKTLDSIFRTFEYLFSSENNGGKCPVKKTKKKPVHLFNSMTSRLSLKKRLSELYVRAF